MIGAHLEATKRTLTQMRHWWNRYTTADDIPSLGTVSRYGVSIGGKGKLFKATEVIAVNLASLSDEALRQAKWVQCVREELRDLQRQEGKSPNKITQDRAVCTVLYFRAALGYTLKRIGEAAFGSAKLSPQRVSNYYGIAVWNIALRAERMGLFEERGGYRV